jgi:predicted nuclease of restriction endonuclease-like (RecB) superfamily
MMEPTGAAMETSFAEVVEMIQSAKQRAIQVVNTQLVELYWQVGAYISHKLEQAEWGDGVVQQLADYLARTQPGLRGFTRANLFRMRKFYETDGNDEKVAPLVRQLPWTHNLIILNQSKRSEEREFYLKLTIQEKWSKRELERQFKAALFERVVLNPVKVSPVVSQSHPMAVDVFRDAYVLEFLDLPEQHTEADLYQINQKLIQIGESSKSRAEPPPSPQFWGDKSEFKSPQNWGFGGLMCRNYKAIWYYTGDCCGSFRAFWWSWGVIFALWVRNTRCRWAIATLL